MDPGIYIDGCHVEIKKMKAPSCYPCCITLGRSAYHVFVVVIDAIYCFAFPSFFLLFLLFRASLVPAEKKKLS